MAIEPGQQLLHYRLIEKIGEGGMGVVWRALDTTLERDVALKVLPDALLGDAQRLARLEREAKLAASLSHPNIATVHGLHASGDLRFVTMELVAGVDLAQRLEQGPIPLDEALELARQIAEALEAAHAGGVIHRDLKPANIKVTPDGRVKVLDFGLARGIESGAADAGAPPSLSPTVTSDRTAAGAVLGTASYMSPEQARGQQVDARTDVWAFGVVLCEMLSGRSPFRGDTVSDTLAAVLKVEPDLDALQAEVPSSVRRLLRRTLNKDTRGRLHHMADARIVLEEAIAGGTEEATTLSASAPRAGIAGRIGWIAALAVVGVIAAMVAWYLRGEPAEKKAPLRRYAVVLDGIDPEGPGLGSATISPDGSKVLYMVGPRRFIRDLDAWESREIVAAEGGQQMFWSDDGESIGFVKDKTLMRVAADGSHVDVISELPGTTASAASGADGKILLAGTYSDRHGLFEIAARGGMLHERIILDDDEGHFHSMTVLPNGRDVLITVHRGATMHVSLLTDDGLTSLVQQDSRFFSRPFYSRTGHVLFIRGGNNSGIWALPFSAERLEVEGEPFLAVSGATNPTISRTGTLTYRQFEFHPTRRLVRADRDGTILASIGQERREPLSPALSPDGKRVVLVAGVEPERDLWLVDVERGTQRPLKRQRGSEFDPVWAPNGERVFYRHRLDGVNTIKFVAVDGSGEAETVVEGWSCSFSRDGKQMVFHKSGGETGSDLWLVDLEAGTDPEPLVQTDADETGSRVSPDGTLMAYESNESGRMEIYLKRFPSAEGKWQVSLDGGNTPRWNPQGSELFWRDEGVLFSAYLRSGAALELGEPRIVFDEELSGLRGWKGFDVAKDGETFLYVADLEGVDTKRGRGVLRVVENWAAE